MKLKEDDMLVGVGIISKEDVDRELLVLTENGYGKKTSVEEYKVQGRGGMGIKTLNVTSKTGAVVGAKVVGSENKELLAMSAHSQVIRTELESVSTLGRATQGVRVMKLRDGDTLASFTLI